MRRGRQLANSFVPVFLLGAILPHLKLGMHSQTAAARCQHRTRQVLTGEHRTRVTLKKNLEKLRFANHLST
jgi:hypothetical protein